MNDQSQQETWEEIQARQIRSRLRAAVPPYFRWALECPIGDLPCEPAQAEQVMQWQPDDLPGLDHVRPWLFLHGCSGSGKSSLAFRWLYQRGIRRADSDPLRVLSPGAINEAYSQGESHQFIASGRTQAPLLLDDLDKVRFSSAVEAGIFAVLDWRFSQQLPTIITTNLTGKSLLQNIGNPETRAALKRRLEESALAIPITRRQDPAV